MRLEDQLATLGELGIELDRGVTIDDLLYSFSREDYEAKPFDLVLFILGCEIEREPWGRRLCSRAWNFDTECIAGDGAYRSIANQLCRVAGRPGAFENLKDHVDLDAREAWVVGGSASSRSTARSMRCETWATRATTSTGTRSVPW